MEVLTVTNREYSGPWDEASVTSGQERSSAHVEVRD